MHSPRHERGRRTHIYINTAKPTHPSLPKPGAPVDVWGGGEERDGEGDKSRLGGLEEVWEDWRRSGYRYTWTDPPVRRSDWC